MNGFLKLPHDFLPALCKEFKHIDVLIFIYLLSRQNYWGNKKFYITDEQIQKDLKISRSTIKRFRKRFKMNPFVYIKSGKFKSSASEYYLKGVLLDTERGSKRTHNKK